MNSVVEVGPGKKHKKCPCGRHIIIPETDRISLQSEDWLWLNYKYTCDCGNEISAPEFLGLLQGSIFAKIINDRSMT